MITIKGYIKGLMKRRAVAMRKASRKKAMSQKNVQVFAELEKSIGYIFQDKSLLKLALTHPGSVNLSNSRNLSNQRLEFLGDAVLQSIISDFVYHNLFDKTEGDLTRARIALTHGKFLTTMSEKLNVPKFIILPKSSPNLRTIESSKEDALEAIIGAIYLDAGFNNAKKIILNWYEKIAIENVDEIALSQNPKGSLQEYAAKNKRNIEYILKSSSGPDHEKTFEMEVFIDGVCYGSASARSKKSAESEAAAMALKSLGV